IARTDELARRATSWQRRFNRLLLPRATRTTPASSSYGYELWLEKGENGSLWCARKGDKSFLAYTGPELLGLVVLWEQLGESWNQQTPDIYSELIEKMED